MKDLEFPTTAAALGAHFQATVVGDGTSPVERLARLGEARAGTLCFFSNRKYFPDLRAARDAVVFTSAELVCPDLPVTFLVVPHPQRAFAQVARALGARSFSPGISDRAVVHPSAVIAKDAYVGPFAEVGEGASIGNGTIIHSFVYVGRRVRIGEKSEVFPHVALLEGVELGNRVKVHAGTVIGSDGFGFFTAESGAGSEEMPQIGTVVIEDDVRIGAKCTIDRATLGETRIERGVKLDDQVHIGHNCRIGRHSILCAQVGIAGSTVLEEGVILGGQVGLAHGLTVGKGARMGAQSGSSSNLAPGETYFLSPAMPIRQAMRVVKVFKKLPQLLARIQKLEDALGIAAKRDGAEASDE